MFRSCLWHFCSLPAKAEDWIRCYCMGCGLTKMWTGESKTTKWWSISEQNPFQKSNTTIAGCTLGLILPAFAWEVKVQRCIMFTPWRADQTTTSRICQSAINKDSTMCGSSLMVHTANFKGSVTDLSPALKKGVKNGTWSKIIYAKIYTNWKFLQGYESMQPPPKPDTALNILNNWLLMHAKKLPKASCLHLITFSSAVHVSASKWHQELRWWNTHGWLLGQDERHFRKMERR